GERLIGAPAASQLERDICIEKSPTGARDVVGKQVDILRPLSGNLLASLHEMGVPGPYSSGRRPGSQPRVPLLERSLDPAPVPDEQWFHVEHTPVQEAAPLKRAAIDQAMNLRVD